ncbi:hypothetical protein EIL87_24645 [Saccharopolyspora rhizosphaerae]|uniref:Uncharacterized protein n=1 Tax=Saccharopolyspora rhizosphaerae TaxID=2492662 RepID=A0A3R8QX25_9PSEU|nr:hypothetical protein [Saccharopolyspora rhizosphaerae]RRO12868.1 hypothetical protein EIL87_24645 [Saccharopolyspora rhizosphaerae]
MDDPSHRPVLDDTTTVAELLRRGPHTPEQGLLATEDPGAAAPTKTPLAGQIVLTTLGVLLVISAAGAGALIMGKPAQLPRPADSAAAISGSLALRPDLALQAAWPFEANGGFSTSEGTGTGTAADVEDAHLANPAAGSQTTALGVVEEFYRRAQDEPELLDQLLAPELGQAEELRTAWTAVDSVRVVGMAATPDGSVSAQVEAVYPDGHRVLLEQHLHVSSGPLPHIVGAELRSARHFPPG